MNTNPLSETPPPIETSPDDPLLGLTLIQMENMPENELRAFVAFLQQNRRSAQTFRATTRKETSEVTEKVEQPPKAMEKEFGDLL